MSSKLLPMAALSAGMAIAFTASSVLFGALDTAQAAERTYSESRRASEAESQYIDALEVLRTMRREPGLAALLDTAHGVFLVPHYARASFIIGGGGGEGVLLTKRNGDWGQPIFYRVGGVSAGFEAGIETGEFGMILTTQSALDSFMERNNWTLSADAGLTVANWSAKTQGSVGENDVIVWSDTKGLLGGISVSLSDIGFDERQTSAFYGRPVSRSEIAAGTVELPRHVVGIDEG